MYMLILLFINTPKHYASTRSVSAVNGHHIQAGFFFSKQKFMFLLPLSQQEYGKFYDGTKNLFVIKIN